jgi:hypothetical protein
MRSRSANLAGERHTLRQDAAEKMFEGCLWATGHHWVFKEEISGFRVTVDMPDGVTNRAYFAKRDRLLFRSMCAEHSKAKTQVVKKKCNEAMAADTPVDIGDMAVKCSTKKKVALRLGRFGARQGRGRSDSSGISAPSGRGGLCVQAGLRKRDPTRADAAQNNR